MSFYYPDGISGYLPGEGPWYCSKCDRCCPESEEPDEEGRCEECALRAEEDEEEEEVDSE